MFKQMSSKLSLDSFKERVENVASEELMTKISGGTENQCHTPPPSDGMSMEELNEKLRQLFGNPI